MRLRAVGGGILLVLLLAVQGHGEAMAAQATPEASPEFAVASLPGFVQGAARTWASDIAATPLAPSSTPDYASLGVVTLSAIIYEFDSDTDAAAAFDPVVGETTGPASTGGIELSEMAVEGFSGRVSAFSAAVAQGPGLTMHQVLLTAQDGPFIYQTIAVALSSVEDAQEVAVGVAQAMIAAPAGAAPATFDRKGASSGGIWDKFPPAGDPILQGMKVELDDQLAPAA